MTGNVFGYMRISTKEEREVQRFKRQEKALLDFAERKGIEYLMVFKDDKSGKNFEDRPEWNKLERLLKKGDVVVFKDLSRFTREVENGYKKYMELMKNGINLVFLDNPTIGTEYLGELLQVAESQSIVARVSLESTVKLLLIVELDRAEQERKILIRRTKDGIKASNKTQGRHRGKIDKMTDEVREGLQEYRRNRGITQEEIAKQLKLSRTTIRKYCKILEQEEKDNERK